MISSLPIILSAIRLVSGPLYLFFGTAPAPGGQAIFLILVALTDLADGRLAKYLQATSGLGAGLDTTADKIFILAILLKLMLAGRLPAPLLYLMVTQFAILAIEGSIYVYRFGAVPIPDMVAKGGTLLAFVTVIVGVVVPSPSPLLFLSVATVLANSVHLVTAFIRIMSKTGQL